MKIRLVVFSCLALIAVGCSAFFGDLNAEPMTSDDAPPPAPADKTTFREDSSEEPVLLDTVDSDGLGYAESGSSDLEYAEAEILLPDVGGGDALAGGIIAPSSIVEQQVTTLKAGEIDDNADWDEYLLYRIETLENYADFVNDVDVTGRHIIRVTDAQGLPILGATVSIYSGDELISTSRTYADGRTLYLPYAYPMQQASGNTIITVEKDGVTSSLDMSLVRLAGPYIDFTLDIQPARDTVQLDVVFLLDATGSMSDEIMQLQQNLLSISQQIDGMGDVDVRYGLVHYRDREDAYITQVHDFTPDVETFQQALNQVRADGGGDTPESLNAGLRDALHEVEWRGEDAIKLIFLVADAPPHLDYPDDYDYSEGMLFASERGIKIHPIASSGLDVVGEYIFRQIGQTTMGRFIFLTYAGGTPGEAGDERDDLAAGEQDYTVDFLDGLVVRLVEDEINAFKGIIED